jgi:hypothetical protein
MAKTSTTEDTEGGTEDHRKLLLPISAVNHPFDSFAKVEDVEID